MKNFYVDINSVLDVRQGVLSRIAPVLHSTLIGSNYHKRKSDFFEGVDRQEFLKVYNTNEVENLMASTFSNILTFLFTQISEMTAEMVVSGADRNTMPHLDVNVYPYELNSDELASLRSVIYNELNGIVGVNIINIPISKLPPALCGQKYVMMVMYDYDRYINAHDDALMRQPQPKLFLIAPMVYFNTDPEKDEETIDALSKGINSLALLEAGIAERICLRFINIEYFSVVYPDDRLLVEKTKDINLGMTLDEYEKRLTKRIPEA